MAAQPRQTPLTDRHRAAGAKLVDFAGWEMPVQYPTGIRAEHIAVREGCGIFDVSHMGQIETAGPGALALLQRLISNDIAAIPVGGAQYGLLCGEDGGVLDDLFTYRLGESRYRTVTNAARHERDWDWIVEHAKGRRDVAPGMWNLDLADATGFGMLAAQGPAARPLVSAIADGELPERMQVKEQVVAGRKMLVCGTGYTGEDGVELICLEDDEDAVVVWDELVGRGALPCGLGARDTLRLEACFHLYGNDLSVDRNPIEAGLGWACREQTGFIGSEAIAAVRAAGPRERLVAFEIDGPGIARQGNPIEGGGVVTSGTLSPTLGRAIGLAYVPAAMADLGTRLRIDVRGRVREAVVVKRPFVAKRG